MWRESSGETSLPRGGFELIMSTEITFQQGIIAQYMGLPRQRSIAAISSANALTLLCAICAALIHSFPAMVGQAIYRKGAIDESADDQEE